MILPPENNQIELRYLKKKIQYPPGSILRHVYVFSSQEPHWCYPNCLRLVWAQNKALTLSKLYKCNMFQDQTLVAKFHRITRLILRQSMQGILTETANGSRRSQWRGGRGPDTKNREGENKLERERKGKGKENMKKKGKERKEREWKREERRERRQRKKKEKGKRKGRRERDS